MNWCDSIHSTIFPGSYARRQVGTMLQELRERHRPGDCALHARLDELNLGTQALEVDNLTLAYRDGEKKDFLGAEKSSLRDAVGRRQSGFALQLARTAFADGDLSAQEQLAIGDIANQHYNIYGACGNLPRLVYTEALDLQAFAKAPSNDIRTWMLDQGKSKEITVPAVRELAGLLFADGSLSAEEMAFAASTCQVFGTPVSSEAQMFLRGLGCTDVHQGREFGPTLFDEARSKDYATVPGMPDTVASVHVDALEEAVAYTLANLA
ncbi:hypothetical protein IV102_21665 [bacterium]|nr:hypothetical protein [bacterium]